MVLVYWSETMRLMRMRVTNFSSFKDTGWIEFSPGINLIVGQNNAGKSALLRVFELPLEDNRHRNAAEYRQERLEPPSIDFDLDVSGHEVEDAMSTCVARGGGLISWPVQTTNADAEWEKVSLFLSEPSHIMELRRHPATRFTSRGNPLHGQFKGPVALCLPLIVDNGRIQSIKNVQGGTQDALLEAMQYLWLGPVFS
jgi:hypothetical protein